MKAGIKWDPKEREARGNLSIEMAEWVAKTTRVTLMMNLTA